MELGIAGLHPMQRTAHTDLAEIERRYGHRISLVGNIDSSMTLPYGSAQDVEREVIEAIQIAAPGGGYILASDHSLHDGIPMRNIWRMIETAKKRACYPLRVDWRDISRSDNVPGSIVPRVDTTWSSHSARAFLRAATWCSACSRAEERSRPEIVGFSWSWSQRSPYT